MHDCIIISCATSFCVFFVKNYDSFMVVICDMAKGRLINRRYFLEIIHD